MKSKLIQIAFLLMFTQLTQAAVAPESFTGSFSVGECSISKADSATITYNGESLNVRFADGAMVADIYSQSTDFDFSQVKVTQDSFTLTNEYFVKVNVGMHLPVLRVRIAQSATGNRVRLSTLYYDTNTTSECVLYRK
jgi:hypothetical protein